MTDREGLFSKGRNPNSSSRCNRDTGRGEEKRPSRSSAFLSKR
ncbi:MAG: hypothetical protein V1689_15430 [Pseudomonadota bacterium]